VVTKYLRTVPNPTIANANAIAELEIDSWRRLAAARRQRAEMAANRQQQINQQQQHLRDQQQQHINQQQHQQQFNVQQQQQQEQQFRDQQRSGFEAQASAAQSSPSKGPFIFLFLISIVFFSIFLLIQDFFALEL